MSREDYVAIGVRLFVVYVLIKTVLEIPAGIQVITYGEGLEWAALYVSAFAAVLAACLFLWFFPLTVARKLLPVMQEPRSESAIDGSVGLSLGLTLLGMWLLTQGVLHALYWALFMFRSKRLARAEYQSLDWSAAELAGVGVTVLEILVGVGLVLGSSGIKRVIYRLRYGSM